MKRGLIWLAAMTVPLLAAESNSFLIRNATVHPVSGPKIENTSVLVMDGKIADIGPKLAAKGKLKVIEGKGLHVYPGMIDAGSPIGLSEISSIRETVDTGEIGEFNPQLRALVAVNPESESIPVTRANGITTVVATPGNLGGGRGASSSVISGQMSMIHLNGWTWEEMEVKRNVGLQITWPVIASGGGRGGDPEMAARFGIRRTPYAEAKKNQEALVLKLREFFESARRYQQAKAAGEPGLKPDLKMEAMIPVLEGKVAVVVFASREREIREAVQWAEKEKVKLVLANVRRPGKMTTELASKKIPVVLGSTFTPPLEDDDPYDEPFSLPGELAKAGVKFCFASFGTQFARNLPYEAAQAVPFGLPYEEALKSVTLNTAEIFGVADQFGSVDKGKVADLIVTDGDPLEIQTQLKYMFVAGVQVDLESKHTKLYKKYLARP
ncbi:MAG: amidohydrolase family protein [Acidobacteria bacterium]|nr:amidohydrolase family protein [Acidobacteriota bacterium]